ncbi:ATP-binding protein [Paenibacillus sp. SYP-B4298]|uniref:ATP-binding protein n=1 Tax=Paenibacillus sp. SYP-B4298 TaxID=2996034 RepID=UPI0022DD1AEA|nr:ATP-binding protein [Paenibacillus sp. SYP-B4298]
MTEYTRSGARRSGDYLQDLVALENMIEMLEHPKRFYYIKVEADEAGYLDDVVALKTDGSYVVKQVKFSTHPEQDDEEYTWDKLLEEREGKRKLLPSLLKKWASSVLEIKQRGLLHEASLITNRKAAQEILVTLLPNGHINFDMISEGYREEIIRQIGEEAVAREFFDSFFFRFDCAGLEDYEEALKRRFYKIGGSDHGWLNLKDELYFWVRNKNIPEPNGEITLSQVRAAARWYQLQSLPQQFEIPEDYVLPSEEFHTDFISEITASSEGCYVLTASPGMGKSTYLSYLYDSLESDGYPVIRHHYFLSTTDRTVGRLDSLKVAESLMNDILTKYPLSLQGLETNNPNPKHFSEWINSAAKYYSDKSKALIVIIDGLDHVWRDQGTADELNKLFENLIPIPHGIIIILGTQPVDETMLPTRLTTTVPRDRWLEIPLLDITAVIEWLQKQEISDELFDSDDDRINEYRLNQLASAFHEKTTGNPLHLRYSLKSLLEQNKQINTENISSLPECSHEGIIGYYRTLWQRLSEQSRSILHLFAACPFLWPDQGIIDCLDPQMQRIAEVREGLRMIRHLLIFDTLGMRPYHSSLIVFVQGQEGFEDYSIRLKRMALDWLQESAPEYLRWAYTWRLEADLGNVESLINGPDRKWVVDSIRKKRPTKEISTILGMSAWYAILQGDLSKFIELGLLRDYHHAIQDERPETFHSVTRTQLLLQEDSYLSPLLIQNISGLSETEIEALAEVEYIKGNINAVEICFNELNNRLAKKQDSSSWNRVAKVSLKLAALNDIEPKKVLKFCVETNSEELIPDYAEALSGFKLLSPLRELVVKIKDHSSIKEIDQVLRCLSLLAIEDEINIGHIQQDFNQNAYIAIYSVLKDGIIDYTVKFPETSILKLKEYELYRYENELVWFFQTTFFCLLANHLMNKSESNIAWMRSNVSINTWPKQLLSIFNDIAKDLAVELIKKDPPVFGWFYERMSDLDLPNWPEDRDVYEFGKYAKKAIDFIGLDLQRIFMSIKPQQYISIDDFNFAITSGYFYVWNWIPAYLKNNRDIVSPEAAQWLINREQGNLNSSIDTFSERADCYAKLSNLASFHKLRDKTIPLLDLCCENLYAHGDHKDMLLFGALELIQLCHKHNIGEVRKWLESLIIPIIQISDFTDGDETRHLPIEIGEVLSEVWPEVLKDYYLELCNREKYYEAEQAFRNYIKIMEYDNKINVAIAKTAIDSESLQILNQLANDGNERAEIVLSFNKQYKIAGHSKEVVNTKAPVVEKPTVSFPNPEKYPPSDFGMYLHTVREYSSYKEGAIVHWFNYWLSKNADDAYSIIKEEFERGRRLVDYDTLFNLIRSHFGSAEAYQWLVEAHKEGYGWFRYVSSRSNEEIRWAYIVRFYPQRWLEFIIDTFKERGSEPWRKVGTRNTFVRLTQYCVVTGHQDIAEIVAHKTMDTIKSFLSPLNFPRVEWRSDLD